MAPLLRSYIKSAEDQLHAVLHLEAAMLAHPPAQPAFQTLLHTLYDVEPSVVGEAAVLAWHARTARGDGQARLRVLAKPFIEWLQTADEDDSDEDDESDDDDDE